MGTNTTTTLVVCLLSFLIAFSIGPAQSFVYDAAMYWNGANALVSGGDVTETGGLALRGVLSAFIYVPAASASAILGAGSAGVAVLVQNALLTSALGGILIPQIAWRAVRPRAWHVWISGLSSAAALRGFSPFTLMDLWAIAFVLLGVLFVTSSKALLCVAGGLAFAFAVNLRPAYLIPILLMAAVWLVFRWRMSLWPLLGIMVGLVPQVLFNRRLYSAWMPWPVDTFRISQIQTQYASFVVRYDTIAYNGNGDPRLFSCSPTMADLAVEHPPQSVGQLVHLFVSNPLESIPFAAEKVTSALQWSTSTPYSGDSPQTLSLFGVLVVAVGLAGLAGLVGHWVVTKRTSPRNPTGLVLIALWAATAGTMVISAPEARFALPMVLAGIIGIIIGVDTLQHERLHSARKWMGLGIGTGLLLAVLLIGQAGLAHPAPRGDATPRTCSQGSEAGGASSRNAALLSSR